MCYNCKGPLFLICPRACGISEPALLWPLLSFPRRPPQGVVGHCRRAHLGTADDWDKCATTFFSLSTQKPTHHLPAPSTAASDR
jgi:hypothetical protein